MEDNLEKYADINKLSEVIGESEDQLNVEQYYAIIVDSEYTLKPPREGYEYISKSYEKEELDNIVFKFPPLSTAKGTVDDGRYWRRDVEEERW